MDITLSRGLSRTTRRRFESLPVVVPQPPRWMRLDPKNRSSLLRFMERFCDTLQPHAVSFLDSCEVDRLMHSYFVLRDAAHVHQSYDLREAGYELHWVGFELFEKGDPHAWDVTLPLVIGKHAFDRLHQRFGQWLFAQSKVYSEGFVDKLLFVLNNACILSGPAWQAARENGWTEVALPLADGALICEVTERHLLARTCLTGSQLTQTQRDQRDVLLTLESLLVQSRQLVPSLRSFGAAGQESVH
jgi:hypothetical protein